MLAALALVVKQSSMVRLLATRFTHTLVALLITEGGEVKATPLTSVRPVEGPAGNHAVLVEPAFGE